MNPLADDLEHVMTHMGDLWEGLRGKRLFVTGGTGFIGRWLLESLLWADEKLDLGVSAVVLTRDPSAFRRTAPHLAGRSAIELREGDIRTFAFPEGHFDLTVHAAASPASALRTGGSIDVFDALVAGTRRVLDFACQMGGRRLLLLSSGAVYGRQSPDMELVPESFMGGPDVAGPLSAYGEGKRAAELLCSIYARERGLEPVIARCFTFVGPYLPLDGTYAVGNFIRDALGGGPIRVEGDGTPVRSYLYAADLAVWLWTVLLRGQACHPYNVGSEESISIAELAAAVAACWQPEPSVTVMRGPNPCARPERYVPRVDRARDECDLRQSVGLTEALDRTVRWHKLRPVSQEKPFP